MSALKNDLIQAIELALTGQWDAAHEIVQRYEEDTTASWIHAVLHKMEGDLPNSGNWYRRAHRAADNTTEAVAELRVIETELRGSSNT
jgi:hypothetical protein